MENSHDAARWHFSVKDSGVKSSLPASLLMVTTLLRSLQVTNHSGLLND